ncbi:aspartate kinase [Carboxylicivirga sediminis]|uniref:Aspartokinase n=1 Tax=Carboxylicivirga sediminis TaxID=2006564 RepID=A0A941IYI1_9BACT|nr:aspartate kinase [Carboxylicivirga sediminis]MBR8536608.1 aspartate kinase [Carboxylicivirga sediminis]
MKKVVAKFGGSNLKKKEDIQKLVRVIKAYDRPMVIVVSAFYGITNHLIQAMDDVKKDESNIEKLVRFLRELKEEAILENFDDKDWQDRTLNAVQSRIKELSRYLTGIHYIGDVPEFVEDVILSYGERLSSLVLTSILQSNGIDAEEALPEQMPLVTDGEFGNATVDFDISSANVQKRLAENKIYVVPGFYGVSEQGKVTLLGRGGSDYSAAAIARCLEAESLDVWKDVDGFMSADPKLVTSPQRITNLSYAEAAELSYFGASILHPRTVEPLKEVGIPIHIGNIDAFDGSVAPRTVVHGTETVTDCIIKSVTYSDDFCILKMRGPGVGLKKGVLAKVTVALDRAGINIKSVITSQIVINLLLSAKDIKRAYSIVEELELSSITELIASEQISTIAVVGEGLLDRPGVAGRLFMALARKDINVQMIVSGASAVASYFMVAKDDRDSAIEAIHDEFFK